MPVESVGFLENVRAALGRVGGHNKRKVRTCVIFAVSGASQEYLEKGALIAVESLKATNPQIPVVIFYDDLNDQQKRMFSGCDLRKGDLTKFRRSYRAITERPDLNTSVFLRFCMHELLDYDVAVYLDSDLVVLDTLEPLFQTPGSLLCREMKDYPLSSQFTSGAELLEAESVSNYLNAVNAGVMKVNLNTWRSRRINDMVIWYAEKHGWDAFAYCDQSLINLVGYKTGLLQFMPRVYNFALWPDMRQSIYPLRKNAQALLAPETEDGLARIVHWTGSLKPWHEKFLRLPDEQQEAYCGPCYEQFRQRTVI